MPTLKPFQKATVRVALKALNRKGGTHKFLIADEVGLGKTIVAGEIIRRLAKSKQPLVVLYVCSNLSIAAQNKRKLLEWLKKEERKLAISSIDRLTLLSERKMPPEAKVHLYTLTPETSLPTRGGRRHDGKKEERALIHALVKKLWPEFFAGRSPGYFKGNAGSISWRILVKKKREFVLRRDNHLLREAFRVSMRRELDLKGSMRVVSALNTLEKEKGKQEVIARFRNALAAMAIEQIQPDLVIFDEFQRFRDLIAEDIDESAARVINALRGDSKGHKSKLLMLSATPYRPYTRNWEDENDNSHRKEFFKLLEFLYGRTAKAKHISLRCSEALQDMEHELRKGDLGSVRYKKARKKMEESLREVICRTERESSSDEHFEILPTNVNAADLKLFKHMAKSFYADHKSAAPAYWSSIPLPMQTMGPTYQTWKKAEPKKNKAVISLNKRQRNNYKNIDPPHPRLRALKKIMPVERLALPWIAPSAEWWPLQGLWNSRHGDFGKVLIFSRFRAVPQAIASLVSYDLETNLLTSDTIAYGDLTKRRSLQPKAGNEALLGHFYPSTFLIKNTDPIANGVGSVKLAKKTIEGQLRKSLKKMSINVRAGKHKRPTWKLIASLEKMYMGSMEAIDKILHAWLVVHVEGTKSTKESGETNFKKMLKAWHKASEENTSYVTTAEFKGLVSYALSSPGVVAGRALRRHWSEALDGDGFIKCLKISWKGLRNYLSSHLFLRALKGSEKRYPEAIRKAALEGNLESVLDEHLWITSKLSGATGAELADELLDALGVRTNNFFLHPLGDKNKKNRFTLRCHVAMPFTNPRTEKELLQANDADSQPIRTDELRRAFNTPFWPHILATTSVGQEGLDFHVWCETLLHWDLCNNPVDLEQREGRIMRYGGLAIRRRLTELLWKKKKMRIENIASPWAKIEKVAEKEHANNDDGGLSPWWVCKGVDIKRRIIELPASEQKHRLKILRRHKLLYRLTLGQPNQEDLIDILSDKYSEKDNLKNIGLNLSAWSALKK